jgi:hypothetical protein
LVAFLDADDEWLPDFLGANMEIHRQHPEIVACFANYRREPQGAIVLREVGPGPRILKDYFAFCLCNLGLGMCASALVASRHALRHIGGFPEGRVMGEDLDTWARLAWSGRIGFIPDELAIYYDTGGACLQHATDGSIVSTYASWRRAGRVPAGLVRSSAAYVRLGLLFEIYDRMQRRDTNNIPTLLSELPWSARASLMGLFAYFGAAFPWCSRYATFAGWRLGCLMLRLRWCWRA